MEKAYIPQDSEDGIYKLWEDSGFFNPDNLELPENAPSYTIVLPPPNITDKLHLGHASTIAIEDLLIRYHRMKGYRTLWVPGTDHAAIATQNAVEKKIFKERGLTRHDLGREKFLEEVWTFLRSTQKTIISQITKLGASLDWSREAFTLDEARQRAVAKMFSDLYAAGVIYRGERVVNWCPRCKSTLSDDEVEYKEQDAKLYTFKYSKDFPISISTTRPETKLGDTALAVHPSDERYKQYIGQEYKVNFAGVDLNIKIVADPMVERDFGTGALGVTPAHSHADWQLKEKYDLESKKIINEDAFIYNTNSEHDGLTVKDSREKVIAWLKENELLEKEEDIKNNLSICYRCSSAIEPLPSKQWFLSVNTPVEKLGGKSLREKALEVAQSGQIKFVPERFEKKYLDWVENLRDWCISRQIWFGHRIPVWFDKNNPDEFTVGKDPEMENYIQDSDTLDTWFSSGMWTFSTLGWPDQTEDLKKFHPTQVLETGYEIITLWVSRMVMMSLFALGEIPFETVYLHGMVLDEHGKKMSKSKGNGVDPMDIIGKFGTDACRLSLLSGTTPGNDMRLAEDKIAAQRNLANKLWNISRYIIDSIDNKHFQNENMPEIKTLADSWILEKFSATNQEINEKLEKYEFSLAIDALTSFTWNDLADWYLEIAKIEKDKDEILAFLLKNILKLWHPFAPFISETIWQNLKQEKLLLVSSWPEFETKKELTENNFNKIIDLVSAIRNARSENKIEPGRKIKATILSKEYAKIIEENKNVISNLKTGLESITITDKFSDNEQAIIIALGSEVEIRLYGAFDEEKEKLRRAKEAEKLEQMINNLAERLKNKEFISKAPASIVEKEQARLEDMKSELAKIKN